MMGVDTGGNEVPVRCEWMDHASPSARACFGGLCVHCEPRGDVAARFRTPGPRLVHEDGVFVRDQLELGGDVGGVVQPHAEVQRG